MKSYSLVDLMNDDSVFDSLNEAKKQTKKSKKTLSHNAEKYNEQYTSEIEAGTRKTSVDA